MNRKLWIVGSVLLVILLILGLVTLRSFLDNHSNVSTKDGQSAPITELVYCGSSDIRPCIVSFSLDAEDNMLINILLPDLSLPDFYLKIMRSEGDVSYECQRIAEAPNNAYCLGIKLPPGEVLRLMLLSTRDDIILAQGHLSIIGLAFPTLEIAISTDLPAGTSATPVPTKSVVPVTPTRTQFPTQAATQPSYPYP